MMKATTRLYLTASKAALVLEGDPRAATLYAAPGDDIPDSAVERFGLADGTIGDGAKERRGDDDKERRSGEDKEKRGGEDKGKGGRPDANALTSIKGIGPAIAKLLTAAGVADVAALAAVDPAAPPAVEGLAPAFDWATVTAAAKAAAPAEAEG